MGRAERLLKIVQVLRRHRRPVRGQLMADELEVSLRTLYRDIADLIHSGVPIRGEAGLGYILGEGYDVPPLMFSRDEMEAMMLGLHWVSRRGDADLVRASQDAIGKIAAVLPPHLKSVFYDSGLSAPQPFAFEADNVDVASLRLALREQRKVDLHYVDERGRETHRMIWPISIAYFDAQRLLIGWCELRQEFRSFRTDRMKRAIVLDQRYTERRHVLIKRWKATHDHLRDA